jgi:CheY-like chemotaxis protein
MNAPDSKTVLIVEDYEDDARLLQLMLGNAGVLNPTQVFFSAEDAIKYLKSVTLLSNPAIFPLPSIIFVDLKLPGIDGFELLRWLRAREEFKGTFIVVLSAAGDLSSIQAAYSLGANTFLVKPCRTADLENLVHAYPNLWSRAILPLPPPEGPPASPPAPG